MTATPIKGVKALTGVHPDLVKVIEASMTKAKVMGLNFQVLEGVRSAKKQYQYFKKGWTQKDGIKSLSKHQLQADGFGHAVLLTQELGTNWQDTSFFKDLAEKIIIPTAKELKAAGIIAHDIVWGADWDGDGNIKEHKIKAWAHFQIKGEAHSPVVVIPRKYQAMTEENLRQVHPDLIKIVRKAQEKGLLFVVTSGLRSQQAQHKLYKKKATPIDGMSKKSKHQLQEDGFAHAIDLAPWPIDWKNIQSFVDLKDELEAIVTSLIRQKEITHAVLWGGSWQEFGHYELVSVENAVSKTVSSDIANPRIQELAETVEYKSPTQMPTPSQAGVIGGALFGVAYILKQSLGG